VRGQVLAIQPTSRGFGWALFESPLSVIDWGTMTAKPSRPGRLLNRLERLINRYEPSILVIRDLGNNASKRTPSVARLTARIVMLAETNGIYVAQYDREAIKMCFRHLGAPTRYEIAQFIALHVEALRHRLPRKAAIWAGESQAMSIFDAAALALTYFTMHGEAGW
jgi:Holliday junction resolvasome RuvABC endonuclease subunit